MRTIIDKQRLKTVMPIPSGFAGKTVEVIVLPALKNMKPKRKKKSADELIAQLKEAFEEMNDVLAGKKQARPAEELLAEL
ncbi:MAG: hypothetical protein LBN39_12480 [Planctomycetaceae bacterium]|nr:hypothetical protein [Planctomycetaceae bacterium]